MAPAFRKFADLLYVVCCVLAGVSLVVISAVIPYSVYTRYVLNQAASWPEPMAILLTIVLTFFGAAACLRDSIHMRVMFFISLMPAAASRICLLIAELLTASVCVFMTIWGYSLCEATWYQSIAEFPWLSVGVTYLPIPISGAITLVFIVERMTVGGPVPSGDTHSGDPHAAVPVD